MSDDELSYVKRQKVIHYGSIEDKERERIATIKDRQTTASASVVVSAAAAVGNKNDDYYDLEKEVLSKDKQLVLEDFERRKKARQIHVSTDDIEVRAHLRQINEPICLFGEGPADRRERLRQLLARLGEDAIRKKKEDERGDQKETSQTWYHEGPESLHSARLWIAEYSIRKANERLQKTRVFRQTPEEARAAASQELYKHLGGIEISCSQLGDTRPLSSCQFSPDCSLIATSSWSGLCKLWTMPDLKLRSTLRGHNCNAGHIVFHPKSTKSQSEESLNLASCGVDGSVLLWNLKSEEPMGNLPGHEPNRVSHMEFHPSGRFLATCCYDHSWRLWDLEAEEEVLHQEGHSKPVHDLSFQCDGSLIATAGLDSFGRVWDLRTGRCIMFMDGHLKGVLAIDFSPNGYQIVTGSEDNSVKVWNLRERKLEYTIAAHTNIISKVMFEKTIGNYIMTASYDNTVKLWAHPGWTPIKTLSGHDGKVTAVDVSPDNENIISSSFDRTFKLWQKE
ncbi:U4/U6 small nuclear ribonucleoprotein Prp4-like [Oppia nitens]|uniref:U4/U6 small nuclear ribonucleoprotein Prp4-like n=1 Tax=Oppia nitens TaxID=1686743 RepID=UPI0023DC19F7|nr:U4/U6 small nuclear ribonucleoprotein Prp4-like [Oppia nitens]